MINQIYLSGRVNKKSLKENKSQYHSHRESRNKDVNCTRILELEGATKQRCFTLSLLFVKGKTSFQPSILMGEIRSNYNRRYMA